MPFQSEAQRRYLYAKHPEIAKEFSKETSKEEMKNLPEKVKSGCSACQGKKKSK